MKKRLLTAALVLCLLLALTVINRVRAGLAESRASVA